MRASCNKGKSHTETSSPSPSHIRAPSTPEGHRITCLLQNPSLGATTQLYGEFLGSYLSARSMLSALHATTAAPCGSPACFKILLCTVYSSGSVGASSLHCSSSFSASPAMHGRYCISTAVHTHSAAVQFGHHKSPSKLLIQRLCHNTAPTSSPP